MPRQLCRSPKIMKVLAEDSTGFYGRVAMETPMLSYQNKVKVTPSLHDKQLMFDMAQSPRDTDELLVKLQMFDFDVNKEKDDTGDYLIHIAIKQGISQLPLLKSLKDIYHASIDQTNHEGFTGLMLAAIVGNVALVDTCLCVLGANPNVANPLTGRTALHYACQRNELEVTSTLLKRGANFDLEDQDGARPDDLAVIFRATDCRDVIKKAREDRTAQLAALIEKDQLLPEELHTTDLYLTDPRGFTLLMLAARKNCLKTLTWLASENGIPLDAQHEQTLKTALSYASECGHMEAVQILLMNGANVTIKDILGYTALHYAIVNEREEVLATLLQHESSLTGLYLGLSLSKQPEITQRIKQAMCRRQTSIVLPALFECCVSGDAESLYKVLEKGDNVNQTSGLGEWPIYLAAENGHIEVVKLLFELGGDICRRHPQTGNSVLHASCSRGHVEVTEFILAHCQSCSDHTRPDSRREPCGMINSLNFRKETPLICAANQGSFRLVNILLESGATSSVLSPDTGQLFVCDFEGIQYIIEKHRKSHAAEVMAAVKDWKPLKKLTEVFLPQFDHNLRTPDGDTPLMMVCGLGRLDLVEFILDSAVYEVFPSPPSSGKLNLSCDDCTDDSGQMADCGGFVGPSRCKEQPITCSSPVPEPYPDLLQNGRLVERNLDRIEEEVTDKVTGLIRNREAVTGDGLPPSASFYLPPESTEAEEENAIRDNISSLLDSIASVSRGSVFVSNKKVSHVCAVNQRDGRTAYHRTVEGGDNVAILKALLDQDHTAVNMQDTEGVSPLHLACKMGRKKIVQKLVSVPYVDLNCRTLNGMLPEEMTSNKTIVSLVQKSRKNQPIGSSFSLRSLPSSIFGFSSSGAEDEVERSLDFDELNTRFMMLKNDIGSEVGMFL